MIKIFPLLGIVSALALVPAAYAQDQNKEQAEATCKQYAMEDKVPEADMKNFMEECMKEMTAEPAEDAPKKAEE